METHDYKDPVDKLIAKRLARLGSRPVDTANLEKQIRAELPRPKPAWQRMLRPLSAAAAGLIIVLIAGFMLLSSKEALASPADMAQMHRDMVSGKIATMKVDSMDEANKAIAAMVGNFPQLAEPPDTQTMACCMRNVGNKKVACVLLNNGSTPVTMVVAKTEDVQNPSGTPTVHNGQTYYVQTSDKLNMVMADRQHHWICLIGELPAEKLMDLSGGLKFSPVP
jgi:hypothetical protein